MVDFLASRSHYVLICHVVTIEERLTAKLDRSGGADACWEFLGVRDKFGYGLLWDGRRRNNSRAHRVAFELWIGPLLPGAHIHHECENKSCCNPGHLRQIDAAEHNSGHHLKTHCRHGHEFTEANTRIHHGAHGTQKICRTCANLSTRKYRAKGSARRAGGA